MSNLKDYFEENKLIILALVVVLGFGVLISLQQPVSEAPSEKVNENRPPLPEGEEVYNVMYGGPGPTISKVVIDPLEGAEPGDTQDMQVHVEHDVGVQSVSVDMVTDAEDPINHTLSLASGTARQGVWGGQWEVENTHNSRYRAIVKASDGEEEAKITLTFR